MMASLCISLCPTMTRKLNFTIYMYWRNLASNCRFIELFFFFHALTGMYEPPHDKTNKITFEPSEDSDQPGHPPSLIRVFAVRTKKHWVLSYPLSALRRPDQTGRMPRLICIFAGRTCHFVGFVMRRFI